MAVFGAARLVVVGMLALGLFGALPTALGTTLGSLGLERLSARADAVVLATVLGIKPLRVGADARVVTDVSVKLERVLDGHATVGTVAVVRIPGGSIPDGETSVVVGAPRFALGESSVLFLRKAGDLWALVALEQGKWAVVAGDGPLRVMPSPEPKPARSPGQSARGEARAAPPSAPTTVDDLEVRVRAIRKAARAAETGPEAGGKKTP
jgi:hypothetical protein